MLGVVRGVVFNCCVTQPVIVITYFKQSIHSKTVVNMKVYTCSQQLSMVSGLCHTAAVHEEKVILVMVVTAPQLGRYITRGLRNCFIFLYQIIMCLLYLTVRFWEAVDNRSAQESISFTPHGT